MISRPKLKLSNSLNSVLTLVTGTAFAQIIQFIFSPLLTRLYKPSEFGLLATVLSITNILAVMFSGRYEMAILLPEDDKNALGLTKLSIIVAVTLTLSSLLFMTLFHDTIMNIIEMPNLYSLWYFLPFISLAISISFIFNALCIRNQEYKFLSRVNVTKVLFIIGFQLLFVVSPLRKYGLVMGQFIGLILLNLIFFKKYFKKIREPDYKTLILNAKRYIDFPKFALPAATINATSLELNNIFIVAFFSPKQVGYYYLAYRILGMPISLIGMSFRQVFFKEAVNEKNSSGKAKNSFTKTIQYLSLISIILFGIGYFIIEELFVILFGEEWRQAGLYARILIPLFAIRFISSSVSVTMSVFEKQKGSLAVNIIILLNLICCYSLTYIYDFTMSNFLIVYTWITFLWYAIFILYYKKLSNGNKKDNIVNENRIARSL